MPCGWGFEVRRLWLTKVIEEEGEDLIGKEHAPHPEYWLKLCEALGLSKEYVRNSEPLFGVKFAMADAIYMAYVVKGMTCNTKEPWE